MNHLAQVRRGIEYIEAHLEDDLETGDVARHVGMSHWHFQRVFKALTNETLKTYVRSRRFARSLERLARTRERVLDVALAAGFDSQASFTRAFSKAFGVTPARYRREPASVAFPRKLAFDEDYLRHLHANLSLEPEVAEQPALHLVGLRTRFFGPDSEKNNMAGKLPALWAQFLPCLDGLPGRVHGACYGVLRQTPARTDELEYWAAAPVAGPGTALPPGLEALQVPAARYARFAHQGHVASLDRTVNYVYSSWLLRSGVRHTYGCDLEVYGSGYLPDSDRSLIHYAIPIAH
jgi:AraC family transcriptional regulator